MITQEQVLKATRQAVAQAMGHEYMAQNGYLEGISAEALVTIGKDITDSEVTTDNFSKALAKQIGLVVVEALNDSGEPLPMELSDIQWGAYVEYALVGDFDVIDDPMFNPTKGKGGEYAALEHDAYLPQTYAKIFDKMQAKLIPISLPVGEGNNPLAQAFTSPSQYIGYIGAVMEALANTITSIKYSLSHTLACAGIAISDISTQTAVHLLAEAKEKKLLGVEATADDFYNSEDCLSYMIERIKQVQSNFECKNATYNNGAMAVRIPKDRQELCMIENVMTKVNTKVKRTSFNENEISLNYFPVSAWQSVKENGGKPFELKAITSVSLEADANNTLGYGVAAYNKNNIVGLLYSKGALAYRTFYRATTTGTTGITGLSTQFHHEAYNMAINTVLPIVAFIVD